MKKESYEFVAILDYAKDGINITFPDIPEAISCADTTKEAIKNAEEVLGLVLYDNELDEQAVKKTLTIPQWLNKMAEAKNVNFSRVLQTALKEYLGVRKNQHK